MNYSDFEGRQQGIYDKFESTHAKLGLTLPLQGNIATKGAFLIAFRHPTDLAEQAQAISSGVEKALAGSALSTVTYGADTLHTTASDFLLTDGLAIDPTSKEHATILDSLAQIVQQGLSDFTGRDLAARQITFTDARANQGSVIALGYGNETVFNITEAIKSASRMTGLNNGDGLKGAWGSHMTLDRFHGQSSLKEAGGVREFLDATMPIGASVPRAIDVGYLQVGPSSFSFTTHEQFKFK